MKKINILIAILSVAIFSCKEKKLIEADTVIVSTTTLQGSHEGNFQWVKNQCTYSITISENVSEDIDYNQWKSKVIILAGRALEEFDSRYGKDIAFFFISRQSQIGLAEVDVKPEVIGTSREVFDRIQAEFVCNYLPHCDFKIITASCLFAKPKSRSQQVLRIIIH